MVVKASLIDTLLLILSLLILSPFPSLLSLSPFFPLFFIIQLHKHEKKPYLGSLIVLVGFIDLTWRNPRLPSPTRINLEEP
jgi:hypothetical protein